MPSIPIQNDIKGNELILELNRRLEELTVEIQRLRNRVETLEANE